jgi:hypothetical protein
LADAASARRLPASAGLGAAFDFDFDFGFDVDADANLAFGFDLAFGFNVGFGAALRRVLPVAFVGRVRVLLRVDAIRKDTWRTRDSAASQLQDRVSPNCAVNISRYANTVTSIFTPAGRS